MTVDAAVEPTLLLSMSMGWDEYRFEKWEDDAAEDEEWKGHLRCEDDRPVRCIALLIVSNCW